MNERQHRAVAMEQIARARVLVQHRAYSDSVVSALRALWHGAAAWWCR